MTEHFGIQPGDPTSEISVEDILDTEGLRRSSVLAVVSGVYAMWARHTDGECLLQKSQFYQDLFEKARQRCHLSVDLGTDGVADVSRVGGVLRLVRD